ncbi:unnamed protein product [Paramecium sonneborni]|uniref:Transmembrane protein n=1 Tax=Paramecium sonneborni TaxID=65129 RepID=A0A8S1RQE7_9CILI|nr:unnamed protein product [Paramecium sonneborni]
MHMKSIKVAKTEVKILLKLSIQSQQSYNITLNIKSQELMQIIVSIQSQTYPYFIFNNDFKHLLRPSAFQIIGINILDFFIFSFSIFIIQLLNFKNIVQSFFAKKDSITNPKNQINCGRILVKRSASMSYYLNFPLESIYLFFAVIIFKQSSI